MKQVISWDEQPAHRCVNFMENNQTFNSTWCICCAGANGLPMIPDNAASFRNFFRNSSFLLVVLKQYQILLVALGAVNDWQRQQGKNNLYNSYDVVCCIWVSQCNTAVLCLPLSASFDTVFSWSSHYQTTSCNTVFTLCDLFLFPASEAQYQSFFSGMSGGKC